MASRYEVEVTITSAKDLKNVNWRHGPIKPYAVVWVDPKSKCSTRVDEEGDTCPYWDQTLVIPLYAPIEDSTLYIDIVHANAAQDTKPLIGSGRLPLHHVLDEVGLGESLQRKIDLKRPSGRPHGKVDVRVCVREPGYRAPEAAYYAPPYGVPAPASRDYPAQYYSGPYSQPPPPVPYAAGPPTGYPYSAPAYGEGQGVYGQEEKKSKYGLGTGLAVGAVAGVLGGVALAEGLDYVEDKIADDVADDVGYDDDDY